ncbi:MAG: hypothetical protein WBV94_25300 [Blastocatellia bacterium]
MQFKLNLVWPGRVILFSTIALLMLSNVLGQSVHDSEDSHSKEMRQMWQNFVKRRPQRQVKVARLPKPEPKSEPKSEPKPSANNPVDKATISEAETQPGEEEPKPDYKVASASIPDQGQDLGITIWRLRPSQQSDASNVKQGINNKRLRHNWGSASGDITYLTAERVETNTPLRDGEMVQLSVEASQDCFVYVIDREQYSIGSKITHGAPYLIFPTMRTNKGYNRTGPGTVINLPSMADDPPFFSLERSAQNHIGEEITFVVSPSPIAELSGISDQTEMAEEQFQTLQMWAAQTGRIELVGGAGRAQTSEEAEAAKFSANDNAKRLKYNSPMPQSIFRVARKADEPFIVTILLRFAP